VGAEKGEEQLGNHVGHHIDPLEGEKGIFRVGLWAPIWFTEENGRGRGRHHQPPGKKGEGVLDGSL